MDGGMGWCGVRNGGPFTPKGVGAPLTWTPDIPRQVWAPSIHVPSATDAERITLLPQNVDTTAGDGDTPIKLQTRPVSEESKDKTAAVSTITSRLCKVYCVSVDTAPVCVGSSCKIPPCESRPRQCQHNDRLLSQLGSWEQPSPSRCVCIADSLSVPPSNRFHKQSGAGD
ncbi:hypothetical protein ACOMHN_050455 [Nucella lapillus]